MAVQVPILPDFEMSGTDQDQIVVRRHDVVQMDAKHRLHMPTGGNVLVMQTDFGPIRVFITQRGSVVAMPSRDTGLVHEGYHWNAVMEFTYYGDTYVGPFDVIKFPDNPVVSQPVSKDNIKRQLRKAASTYMLKQESDILRIALQDIALRLRENRERLAETVAELNSLPPENPVPLVRRFEKWFGTFWVSPGEGELAVRGGGLSGSITVSGKICKLEATLPLSPGRELAISLVNILGGEKQEEVPDILRSSLLELAETVRRNHDDLIEAARTTRARRLIQIEIAKSESKIVKLEHFAMMYRDRLDPALDNQERPRPSSAA